MSLPLEVLAREVLQLSTAERVRLLEQLINSLDADKERDRKWNELAAQRDAEADADPGVLAPASEALARLRADVA